MSKKLVIMLAIITIIIVTSYTILNICNSIRQLTISKINEENMIVELEGTKIYNNLIPNKYYVLTRQGLKLYNGTSIYGIQDEMEYPGLLLGEIMLHSNKTYTITIITTVSGVKEHVFSLILVNTKTNTTHWIPLASTKPTTMTISTAKTGGPAIYKACLYGYIKTSNTKTLIHYSIKIYSNT